MHGPFGGGPRWPACGLRALHTPGVMAAERAGTLLHRVLHRQALLAWPAVWSHSAPTSSSPPPAAPAGRMASLPLPLPARARCQAGRSCASTRGWGHCPPARCSAAWLTICVGTAAAPPQQAPQQRRRELLHAGSAGSASWNGKGQAPIAGIHQLPLGRPLRAHCREADVFQDHARLPPGAPLASGLQAQLSTRLASE